VPRNANGFAIGQQLSIERSKTRRSLHARAQVMILASAFINDIGDDDQGEDHCNNTNSVDQITPQLGDQTTAMPERQVAARAVTRNMPAL
jgi:hypothetical protein